MTAGQAMWFNCGMRATFENLTRPGVVIHGNIDRTVLSVASPVYPLGSSADRQERLSRQHGHYTLRLFLDDGSQMLVHPGNELCASRRGE